MSSMALWDAGHIPTLTTQTWITPSIVASNPSKKKATSPLESRRKRSTLSTATRRKPFFLYVAYNAVHAPPEAPEEDIKNVTGDKTRDTLMAMIKHLDMGVGEIVNSLKKHDIFDNTLLIFLTDNGGSGAMRANNAPLRGFKQMDYEGGIHVPFIVSWPAQLKGGKKCHVPMWSIDLFATALDAAGLPMPKDKPLDGKSILPALKGETDKLHDELYWSSAGVPKESGPFVPGIGSWSQRKPVSNSSILKKTSAKPLTLLPNTRKWFPNSRPNTTHGSMKWRTR